MICSLLAATQLTSIMVYVARLLEAETVFDIQVLPILRLARLASAICAATDSFIATIMVILLMRIRSGFRWSDSAVHRIVVYTLSSSLLTGLTEIAGFILTYTRPSSFWYFAPFLTLPKCMYTSSLITA